MPVVGKIKERNLDPELLGKIFTGGKVDMSAILSSYVNKYSDKITADMLDDAYQKSLAQSLDALRDTFKLYRNKADKITSYDLDANLLNLLDQIQERIDSLQQNSSASEVDGIKNTIEQIQTTLAGYTNIGDKIANEVSNQISRKLIDTNSSVEEFANKLNELDKKMSQSFRSADEKIKESDLGNDILKKINKINELDQRIDSTQQTRTENGSIGQWMSITTGNVATGKEIFYDASVAYSSTEIDAMKKNNETPIIDVPNCAMYELVDNIAPDGTSSGLKYDKVDDLSSDVEFNNTFIRDIHTGAIFFISGTSKKILPISSNNGLFYKEDILIGANKSVEIPRANAIKHPINVLVKDTDSNSRSYNMYINSEGIATVAYSTDKYVVYNDSDSDAYFSIQGA